MSVVITRITEQTAAVLDRVADEVFDHAIDQDRVAAYLATPLQMMCVAVDDGLVVGQVRSAVFLHPDRPPELYVENLGVAPTRQRRGIATRLMDEAFRFGREHGCVDMYVCTEADNEQAIGFYRSLGLDLEKMVYFEGRL